MHKVLLKPAQVSTLEKDSETAGVYLARISKRL